MKILIVEDEPVNHPLYKNAFEKEDFKVMICRDAEGDFLDRVARFAPDIISMDLMIGMQGDGVVRDGFDAIAMLKKDERTKAIPVIVLSNFHQDERVQRAKEMGATDYITVQGQALKEIVRNYRRCVENPKKYRPVHPLFVD